MKFNKQYRSKRKELEELTLSDWKKIDDIAQEVNGHQLEVRYMKKFERLKVMLESDGAGGLRYVVGPRSANCGASSWPYAMDEWGNIYTADDQFAANKAGYAMFNHSTFTAGDKVVCAGMLQIDAAGKLTSIDTNSGHYKPSRAQLQTVVGILQSEYNVDMSGTFILTYEKHPDPDVLDAKISRWNPGSLRPLYGRRQSRLRGIMKTKSCWSTLLVRERWRRRIPDHRGYPALFQRRAQESGGERGCHARGQVRLQADRGTDDLCRVADPFHAEKLQRLRDAQRGSLFPRPRSRRPA